MQSTGFFLAKRPCYVTALLFFRNLVMLYASEIYAGRMDVENFGRNFSHPVTLALQLWYLWFISGACAPGISLL